MTLQESLNTAHHELFAGIPTAWMVGHDIADPLGGPFGITRGLSTQFPDRVCSASVGETSLIGIGTGLSLCGQHPVVEVDALAKGVDMLLNFASSAVYAPQGGMNLLVRCPFGGTRYHSREKYLIGYPRLDVFELTPFHDVSTLLIEAASLGHPAVLYEDRTLYTSLGFTEGKVDDLFEFTATEPAGFAKVRSPYFLTADCVIIASGGMSISAAGAARRLYEEHEIETQVLVPARLYPFDVDEIRDAIEGARFVIVVEDAAMGGAWGDAVSAAVTPLLWGKALAPVLNVRISSSDLDPAARITVCRDDIVDRVVAAVSARADKK